jgi:membrane-anchored glycerophosphoryl diester phosphodiesterase (GDPDase)
LLLGFVFGLAALVVVGGIALSGSQALTMAGLIAVVAAGAYVWVRCSLSAPVVAVERVMNPVRALRRSWQLTRGQGMRILVFYALILLVFLILLSIVLALLGIVLALVVPARPAAIGVAVVSAGLQAIMALTFIAAIAAAHGQLAGDPGERLGATFD